MSDITAMVAIRSFLLADSNITDLVGQKIFFSDLYSLYNDDGTFSNPAFQLSGVSPFPSLILKMEEGPGNIYLKEFPLLITAYSNLHYKEAYDILQVVHERIFSTANPDNIAFSFSGSPSEYYEQKLRLYGTYMRIKVFVTC